MFTGIVKNIGIVKSIEKKSDGMYLTIEADTSKLTDQKSPNGHPALSVGASMSVDGVCQTVLESDEKTFIVQCIPETLKVTTLYDLMVGSKVNLEPAMKLSDSIDGHLVQGHIDATGTVLGLEDTDGGKVLRIKFPFSIENFIVYKGSVSVNGVSLTISKVGKTEKATYGAKPTTYDDFFEVSLIRHTLENTNLGFLKKNDKVNLEADMMARYAAKMIKG